MKFFIDTANVNEIRAANDMGVIAGVTTNPSLIAKEGRDYAETLAEIATIVDGPISGEVKATTTDAEKSDLIAAVVAEVGDTKAAKGFIEVVKPIVGGQAGQRKTIGEFVSGYEVEKCPLKLWEKAILEGYAVFRQLKENQGGWIIGNREQRTIKYMPLESEK